MIDELEDFLRSLPLRPELEKINKKEYNQEYFQANKKRMYEYGAAYREKLKHETVEAYGGRCVLCGESDPIVLAIDHIHDDAVEDRIVNKHNGGYKLYQFLKREGWPKGSYQLLCHNCNFRKEYYRRKR